MRNPGVIISTRALLILTSLWVFPSVVHAELEWKVLPSTASFLILKGSERPVAVLERRARELCFVYERKAVYAGINGEFVVRERKGPPMEACAGPNPSESFRVVRTGPFYFFGLKEPWLFLDSGTGNERGFHAYDIETGSQTVSITYFDPIRLHGEGVTLWRSPLQWISMGCDWLNGSEGWVLELKYYVHLRSGKKTAGPIPRCGYIE